MNLTKMFETQKALDDQIVKQKGLEGRDLFPEKILALQVELGELANEWRGFKFWSEDREPRTVLYKWTNGIGQEVGSRFDPTQLVESFNGKNLRVVNSLLEEYVDCLHFILSIGLDVGDTIFNMDDYEIHFEDAAEVGLTEQFISTNWLAGSLMENKIHYEQTLFNVLKLGEMLGFTWEQVEDAYYAKNKINHERQASGY